MSTSIRDCNRCCASLYEELGCCICAARKGDRLNRHHRHRRKILVMVQQTGWKDCVLHVTGKDFEQCEK